MFFYSAWFFKICFRFSASPQVFLGDEEVRNDGKPHGRRKPRTGTDWRRLAQIGADESIRKPCFHLTETEAVRLNTVCVSVLTV